MPLKLKQKKFSLTTKYFLIQPKVLFASRNSLLNRRFTAKYFIYTVKKYLNSEMNLKSSKIYLDSSKVYLNLRKLMIKF